VTGTLNTDDTKHCQRIKLYLAQDYQPKPHNDQRRARVVKDWLLDLWSWRF